MWNNRRSILTSGSAFKLNLISAPLHKVTPGQNKWSALYSIIFVANTPKPISNIPSKYKYISVLFEGCIPPPTSDPLV